MIVKYKSKSKEKFFDLFERIEFLLKTFVLTLDNFDHEFFSFSSNETFFFSSFDESFRQKRIKKCVKKKETRFKINYYKSETKSREGKKV